MTDALEAYLAGLPRHLHDMPYGWAERLPEGEALIEGETVWSWRRFADEIAAAAAALDRAGVRPGDRLMFVHENGLAAVTLLFAASAAKAWAVPVNARLADDEIDHIAEHAGARRVLFTTGVSPEAAAHGARFGATPFAWTGAGDVAISTRREAAPEPVTGDPARDVAVLLYTTGTTGRSKGVMLSHRGTIFVASGPGSPAPPGPQDCAYAALPISHAYGLCSTLLRAVFHGTRSLLQARFSAQGMLQALASGVTICNGVPAMYARLLEHLEKTGESLKAPHVRALTAGGAPVDPDLARRVEARFGLGVTNGYGLTEAGPTVSRSAAGDPDTSGAPITGVEVRAVGPDGRDVAQGEAGEIWVRGPNLMLGYYRDAEATAAALTPDGWLKSGDIGVLQADGRITIVDRAKEIIIRSGFNVSPVEVEEALNAHPGVIQSAVLGAAVAGNEAVIAFVEVTPGGGASEAALLDWARKHLAPYKRPARIEVVEALPAAPTGKVLKAKLRDRAAALAREKVGA
jgi:acyl-CoA synthetase (AMP-forming)/AMP-acid ligase II